jgi:hypothetical protein
MQLTSTLAFLVDAAAATPRADLLLAKLGAHLIEDGLPLAGGALTLASPHPLIARRTSCGALTLERSARRWDLSREGLAARERQVRRATAGGAGS